jgi:ribosomal protein S18 acetylase RimI-like enzyme
MSPDRTGWRPRTSATDQVDRLRVNERQMHELDNPVWWSLNGRQRALGSTTALAARFDPEISPFGGLADGDDPARWEDLRLLAGPGNVVGLTGDNGTPPPSWTVLRTLAGLQMIGDRIDSQAPTSDRRDAPKDLLVLLGADDVPDMLELVARTTPGPFLARTVEFGGYVGIRRDGRLIAMAGERLRPLDHTEVSAVATDPDHRRQGLAELVVRRVAADIIDRGETPFLHTEASNSGAIRLYQSIGFSVRRPVTFTILRSSDHG